MHRTQIYFEETLFEAIRKEAVRLGISVSAYIRDRMRQDLEKGLLRSVPVGINLLSCYFSNERIELNYSVFWFIH
jgi:hypothetical protein